MQGQASLSGTLKQQHRTRKHPDNMQQGPFSSLPRVSYRQRCGLLLRVSKNKLPPIQLHNYTSIYNYIVALPELNQLLFYCGRKGTKFLCKYKAPKPVQGSLFCITTQLGKQRALQDRPTYYASHQNSYLSSQEFLSFT